VTPRSTVEANRGPVQTGVFWNANPLPKFATLSPKAKRVDETGGRKDASRDQRAVPSHDPRAGTAQPTSDLLTTGEVANFLRVNRSTICRLAGRGELPAFKIGSDWRFSRERIEAWLKSRNRTPED
jgi:excisionase family DNA binding protein